MPAHPCEDGQSGKVVHKTHGTTSVIQENAATLYCCEVPKKQKTKLHSTLHLHFWVTLTLNYLNARMFKERISIIILMEFPLMYIHPD